MTMKLPEHIEDAIEEQGWSIHYTDDGCVELESFSPLGENLVETIETDGFVRSCETTHATSTRTIMPPCGSRREAR